MSGLREDKGFVENRTYKKKFPRYKIRIAFHGTKFAFIFVIILIVIVLSSSWAYSSITSQRHTKENLSDNYDATANHVVINEVYYDVKSGYSEPQCEWIELYNPASSDVDISGWILTDNPHFNTTRYEGYWVFPSDTKIPAGGYILIVHDATYKGQFNKLFPGVTPDFDTNTSNSIPDVSVEGNLQLANTGDDIHLFDSSKNEIDVMWYGNGGDMGSTNAAKDVSEGYSLARYYNAEDTDNPSHDFYDEDTPTPRAQNTQSIPELNAFFIFVVAASIVVIVRLFKKKH